MEANSIHGVLSAVTAGLGVSVMARSAVTENLQILEGIYPDLPSTSVVAHVSPDAPPELTDRFLTFLVEGLASHGIG